MDRRSSRPRKPANNYRPKNARAGKLRAHSRGKIPADCLFIAAQSLAAGQGIDPALIASRQEIGEFYRVFLTGQTPENSRILRGWRRQAAGQTLLDLLHGKTRINLQWKDGLLQF